MGQFPTFTTVYHMVDGSVSTMRTIGNIQSIREQVEHWLQVNPTGVKHLWQHGDGCLYEYPPNQEQRVNTYTKLRDGTWGIRSTNPKCVRGYKSRVTVTKKNGDTEAHDIKCFWHGKDGQDEHIALCTIEDVNCDVSGVPKGVEDFNPDVPTDVRDRYGG